MAKNKSLAAQIEEIEVAREKLLDYEKLFDKACQLNFGLSAKKISKIIEKKEDSGTYFESEIRRFFDLKTDKDLSDFINIMCTEHNLNYFKRKQNETNI